MTGTETKVETAAADVACGAHSLVCNHLILRPCWSPPPTFNQAKDRRFPNWGGDAPIDRAAGVVLCLNLSISPSFFDLAATVNRSFEGRQVFERFPASFALFCE